MKMKMRMVSLLAAGLCLAGCAGQQQATLPTERLELVSMTPLPPVTSMVYASGLKLNVLVHVLQDGTVENVRMLGSSGDPEWDSLALAAMRQWRYAPPVRDGGPADIWFRQLVVIQIQEPIVMTIGEIASGSLRAADSLYALMEEGADLDSLFRKTIGTFDIRRYPPGVMESVRGLGPGEHTHPIRLGKKYVIYKRFGREEPGSPQ